MYPGKVCLSFIVLSALLRAALPADIDEDIRQGRLLQSQGRFAEAERSLRAAVRHAEASPGATDAQLAALSNLASVELDLAHPDEAARLYDRGLRIIAAQAGEDDPRVQEQRIRIAELFLDAGQLAEAEKMLRPAIEHLKSPAGGSQAGNAERAAALDVLACLYMHQKKPGPAEGAERDALAIFESSASPDRSNFGIALLHMASILDASKRSAEALPFAERARAIFKTLPLAQPAMEASVEITLASIYGRLRRAGDAESSADEGLRIIERFYGPDHQRTAVILLGRAAVLRAIGRKQEARQSQRRAEAILATGGGHTNSIGIVPVEALLPGTA